MAKLQLLVDDWCGEPWLCVLAGPTFHALLAALKALPRRTYVVPYFWIVDTDGLARLRAAGLQVEAGSLNPVLAELAHRMSRRIARDWLPTEPPYHLDTYSPSLN